jgi:hypothetical protein
VGNKAIELTLLSGWVKIDILQATSGMKQGKGSREIAKGSIPEGLLKSAMLSSVLRSYWNGEMRWVSSTMQLGLIRLQAAN